MRGAQHFLSKVETPGAPTPDGDGGFSENWTPVSPGTWWCSIEPAASRNLERQIAGTVEATTTHILRGDYHPGITTVCRILVPDLEDPSTCKRFDVTSVTQNQESHHRRIISYRGRRFTTVYAAEYITDQDPRPRRVPVERTA